VDSSGLKDAQVQSYSPGGANVPLWKDMLPSLSNNTEPSAYSGDAPYGKLLWPFVIYGHAHLNSRTDSQSLRAKYCIMGIPRNTAF